jgi:hypothetical protein
MPSMSQGARELNTRYITEMQEAKEDTVLGRVRDIWWPAFLERHAHDGAAATLDSLDEIVAHKDHKTELMGRFGAHADRRSLKPDTDQFRVSQNQFIKSNLGKMFERFACLALAYSLHEVDSKYCVLPFRTDSISLMHGKGRDSFRVNFKFGDGTLQTLIDADTFAFAPDDPESEIFMISVKSTLKDRFHNVPFWNLLRRIAVSDDFPEVAACDVHTLSRVRYVAVCSDFAEEQPDFGTDAGARNLLQIDASLLDGAYVSSSRARGLPNDCVNHLGDIRQHAFYRYSCLYNWMATST